MPTLPPPGPSPSGEIAALIEAARRGSAEALGRLLEHFRPYLLAAAGAVHPQHLQAKAGNSDLVQQSVLEAHQNFHRFEGTTEAELAAWLRCILDCNAANVRREFHTAKRDVGREVALSDPASSNDGLAQLAATGPSPSGRAAAGEEAQAIDRALARLPEDYRQVIVLRIREQRSFAEVGKVMNRSADAVRKLWTRAVERLQQELKQSP
jgi:RNA polymerase sigma-70 factor (ECF subfamily)